MSSQISSEEKRNRGRERENTAEKEKEDLYLLILSKQVAKTIKIDFPSFQDI